MTAEARQKRGLELQGRIFAQQPALSGSPKDEFLAVRAHLIEASDEGQIQDSPAGVYGLLRFGTSDGHALVTGGEIDRKRDGSTPHFTRRDGARINFSISLRDERPPQLEAYRFEIAFPSGTPAFLRYDLDLAHVHEGLRSHLHPASDTIRVPAPVASPLEMLDLLIYGTG